MLEQVSEFPSSADDETNDRRRVPMSPVAVTATAAVVVVASGMALGCGRGSDGTDDRSNASDRDAVGARDRDRSRAVAPPPPDAGTAAGHGADVTRVLVPRSPKDPPAARIALSVSGDGPTLAEASQPGAGHSEVVVLEEPRLTATSTGEDDNEGVARVRVSLSQRVACRGRTGAEVVRHRIRYHPPPQIERIRSRPGARLPARRSRSLLLRLATDACAGEPLKEVRGELWGEAINGSGLEAVTPHIRFRFDGA